MFCGYCGTRLVLTTNSKRLETNEFGNLQLLPKPRYICYRKTRHHNCDGHTGYTAKKLDRIVEKVVLNLFERVKDKPQVEVISKKNQDAAQVFGKKRKITPRQRQEYDTCKAEGLKTLRGESSPASTF